MIRLGVLSDTHIALPPWRSDRWHGPLQFDRSVGLMAGAVEFCIGQNVDGVIVCGDIADRGDLASMRVALQLLAMVDRPRFVVAGNHDLGAGNDTLRVAVSRYGHGAQILDGAGEIINGIRIAGTSVARMAAGSRPVTTDSPQLGRWGDTLTIWVTHYPVLSLRAPMDRAALRDAGAADDYAGQRAVVDREAPTLVVHGHQHVRAVTVDRHVAQWSQASLIEASHDVTVLEIDTDTEKVLVRASATPLLDCGRVRTSLASPKVELRYGSGQWAVEQAQQ